MNQAEKMLKHLEEHNLPAAKKQFSNVLKKGTVEEKLFLAEQLTNLGYFEQALQLYESLLHSYPDEGEFKVRIAELLIDLERDDDAFSYLQSISPDDPNYPVALLVEADLYHAQGLYEVSEVKLLQAKELLPDDPVIDFALAELYMSQGRFLEASRLFQLLIEANETKFGHVDVYARMAEALSAGGAFEKALSYYEKALENETNSDLLFGYGLTAYQAGQYKRGIQIFKQLEQLDPDYDPLYLYLAKCYEHEELLQEAFETIKKGLSLNEFNKDMFFYAGKLALKMQDEEKAQEYLEKALTLDPEFVEAALTLNKLFLHQEKYEEVVKLSTSFLEDLNPDPNFYWDAAFSFQQLENYKEALNYYELAYTYFNNNDDFLEDYGFFLMEMGNREKAIEIFSSLVERNKMNEEWLLILERLLED